ncbi:MAG: hypothetical protein RSF67_02860 [Clostridia bacterium]
MSKKICKIIILIIFYIISLILFELVIGIGNFDKNAIESAKLGIDNPFVVFTPFAEAGICHFICVSIIAIYVKFNKNINSTIKNTIFCFPLFTFILTFPMMFPTIWIARLFQIPFGNI